MRFLLALLILFANDPAAADQPVNLSRIEATLSTIDVAHHWLAGKHVD